MSRKKLSIVNQKEAATEATPEPDRIDLKLSEKIAAATLLDIKERLEKDLAGNQQQINQLGAEILDRAGVSKESQTPYTFTLDALIKQ
jgi:hypothetical protein